MAKRTTTSDILRSLLTYNIKTPAYLGQEQIELVNEARDLRIRAR